MIKVTLTNQEILNVFNTLKNISNSKNGEVKEKWLIAKNLKIVQKEVETYEEERKKILVDGCKKDSKGECIYKNDGTEYDLIDKQGTLNKLDELTKIENEIELNELHLNKLGEIGCSSLDLMNLYSIILE